MTETAWASEMQRKAAGHLRAVSENQSHKIRCRSAVGRVGRQSTHCSPWPISRRATGLPRNLTFAHAAEKVSDSDSSRSQVASFERERISAERLHPKTAYSRCRPTAVDRVSK